MSFEDDMIEDGFNNEMDYLDYLMDMEKERENYTYGMSEGDSCYSPTKNRKAINQYAATDDENGISDCLEYVLTICSDIHCELYANGILVAVIRKNDIVPISIIGGKYIIRAICTYNPLVVKEFKLEIYKDEHLPIAFLEDNRCYTQLKMMMGPDCSNKYALNYLGEKISKQYDYVGGELFENMATVILCGKYGFIDNNGYEVIPCIYDYALPFVNGLAAVCAKEAWGFINHQNEIVIPLIYEDAGSFEGGLAYVQKDGKYGYIDKFGKVVIPFQYDDACDFNEGLAQVRTTKILNLLELCEDEDEITKMCEDLNCTEEDLMEFDIIYNVGFIDNKGVPVIPLIYNNASEWFCRSKVKVEVDGKWGLVDKTGELIIPVVYDDLEHNNSNIICARLNGKFGYLSVDGENVTSLVFDKAYPFRENRGAIQIGKKWGFVDSTGALAVPCRYDKVYSFNECRAGVQQNGKWGFINPYGNIIIPCIYDEVNSFKSSISVVRCASSKYMIDKYGNMI